MPPRLPDVLLLLALLGCPPALGPNVANEPRAAVTGSHRTVGRVGSICALGSASATGICAGKLAGSTFFPRHIARSRLPCASPVTTGNVGSAAHSVMEPS